MLQPKVYSKLNNKVFDVVEIHFKMGVVVVEYTKNGIDYEVATLNFSDCKFMENTGLKDKNGKYIYVGDILKFDDEFPTWDYEGEVSACGGFNVAIVTKEKNFITLTNFQADDGGLEEILCTRELIFDELNFEDYEVIGYIYEDKELVEIDKTNQKG